MAGKADDPLEATSQERWQQLACTGDYPEKLASSYAARVGGDSYEGLSNRPCWAIRLFLRKGRKKVFGTEAKAHPGVSAVCTVMTAGKQTPYRSRRTGLCVCSGFSFMRKLFCCVSAVHTCPGEPTVLVFRGRPLTKRGDRSAECSSTA